MSGNLGRHTGSRESLQQRSAVQEGTLVSCAQKMSRDSESKNCLRFQYIDMLFANAPVQALQQREQPPVVAGVVVVLHPSRAQPAGRVCSQDPLAECPCQPPLQFCRHGKEWTTQFILTSSRGMDNPVQIGVNSG